ncbi:MAG: class I SAM-dependent methyltransferase [Chlamydiia bacterium]|nr:class I SAM-dependent methyltransferase [Chlamydiia bacterium]
MDRSPHLLCAQSCWKRLLQPGDVAIDATCGNGYDTLFLAQLPLSNLLSIDIQPEALRSTAKILSQHLTVEEKNRVSLHLLSHEYLTKLPLLKPPRLIVYNLGYLPGGNKLLTTRTETTLASLKEALDLLETRGAISMTCYPGHEEGGKEELALLQYASALPSSLWQVWHQRWLNRPKSPSLLWIERLGD